MFDGGCEIENGIWRGRSRLQSGQYLIFSDNNVIFAFSVCIYVYLKHWLHGHVIAGVRMWWSCGSEDCSEDNPSKLSFFAKYCVSSQPSHPVSLQFKQEPGQSESDSYYLQESKQCSAPPHRWTKWCRKYTERGVGGFRRRVAWLACK